LKRLKRYASGESVATSAVPAATPARRSYLWPVVGGGVVVLLLLALLVSLTVTAPTEAIDSIAVLPFDNRSGQADLEYLSDGIAEAVTNRLSQLSALDKVISSSSVRAYKGQSVKAQAVADELGVRAVVMGNLTQLEGSVRINVQLIDGRDNSTLWGETYTRPRSAVYEMEEYLSKEIADALGIELSGEEGERLSKRYTDNNDAHEAYLKGRAEFAKRVERLEGKRNSIQHFEKAIEEDPDYPLPYVALARTYWSLAQSDGVIPYKEALPKMEELAMKALELDSRLAEAHSMLATVKRSYYWDWQGAEKEYELALELDPGSSQAHIDYSWFLTWTGRHDEAITWSKRGMQLDPLRSQFQHGHHFYLAGLYPEALEEFLSYPSTPRNQKDLQRLYVAQGKYPEAVAAFEERLRLQGSEEDAAGLSEAYEMSGKQGYWRWMLDYELERSLFRPDS